MNEDGEIRRWPWIVAAGIVFLLLVSIRPEHRLRSSPTPGFASAEAEQPNRSQWAQAYWECARSTIQWKYAHAEKLPVEPPPEFHPVSDDLRRLEKPEIRLRYWAQLRNDWLVPSSWDVSYRVDFGWIPASLNQATDYIRDLVARWVPSFHS